MSLADWSSGSCADTSDFDSGETSKPYGVIIDVLEKLKNKHPRSYHRVLHGLFVDARYVSEPVAVHITF